MEYEIYFVCFISRSGDGAAFGSLGVFSNVNPPFCERIEGQHFQAILLSGIKWLYEYYKWEALNHEECPLSTYGPFLFLIEHFRFRGWPSKWWLFVVFFGGVVYFDTVKMARLRGIQNTFFLFKHLGPLAN